MVHSSVIADPRQSDKDFGAVLSVVIPEKLSLRCGFATKESLHPETHLYSSDDNNTWDSRFHFLSSEVGRKENVSGMTADADPVFFYHFIVDQLYLV